MTSERRSLRPAAFSSGLLKVPKEGEESVRGGRGHGAFGVADVVGGGSRGYSTCRSHESD